ncbi:MAG TPA: nicotinate-nucleotide--dimethylbenzimidazole phosphoribosyltransferase [Candidatus Nanopelagicales bacterium]|nr:nicotinate-nucleotide--dimethylbenzimidazole phosphoribosyltransferase [Candidatus Nanopelagicales bacterium]
MTIKDSSPGRANSLSGDLKRLASWWGEHRPSPVRDVRWLSASGDEAEVLADVDRAIDAGATLLVLHHEGNNDDAVAARAIIAAGTGSDASAVFAQERDMDDLTWMRAVAAIRDARSAGMAGTAVNAMASAFIRCSERRTPVLFDGLLAHAGALQANIEEPGIGQWWLPAATSTDPAIAKVQGELTRPPALDLHVDGRGTAGIVSVLAVLDVVTPANESGASTESSALEADAGSD